MRRRRETQSGKPANDVNAAMRAVQAMELRRMGYDYAEIARRCGYANKGGAWKAVNRELDRTVHDSADALRIFQLGQINEALVVVMEAIKQRDKNSLWAVDRLTPLLKRQAELMALDAVRDDLPVGAAQVKLIRQGVIPERTADNDANATS